MKGRPWKEWACIAGIISGIEFVVMTFVAMLFYKGGSKFAVNAAYYDFFSNFFSDLGQVDGFAGQDNLVPFVFFELACFLMAACYAMFFPVLPAAFAGNPKGRRLTLVTSFFGVLASAFVIAVAFLPEDINMKLHVYAATGAYLFIGIAAFVAAGATWKVKAYPRATAWAGIAIWILAWTFAAAAAILGTGTPEALFVVVTLQKLGQYAICFWSTLFAWATLRILRSGTPNPNPAPA